MIRERQREGIVRAKQKGIYKGRSKAIDDEATQAPMSRQEIRTDRRPKPLASVFQLCSGQ